MYKSIKVSYIRTEAFIAGSKISSHSETSSSCECKKVVSDISVDLKTEGKNTHLKIWFQIWSQSNLFLWKK